MSWYRDLAAQLAGLGERTKAWEGLVKHKLGWTWQGRQGGPPFSPTLHGHPQESSEAHHWSPVGSQV